MPCLLELSLIKLGMFNVYYIMILTCDLHVLHPTDGGQSSACVVKEKQTLILTQLTVHLKTGDVNFLYHVN